MLKKLMVEAPVLAYSDALKVYVSADGAGAVLLQCLEGREQVVAYFSTRQRNYCVTRQELAVSHVRPYLYGSGLG